MYFCVGVEGAQRIFCVCLKLEYLTASVYIHTKNPSKSFVFTHREMFVVMM